MLMQKALAKEEDLTAKPAKHAKKTKELRDLCVLRG